LKTASGEQAAFELEALPADALARVVEDSIVNAIDWSIADTEIDQEKRDEAELTAIRTAVKNAMGEHYGLKLDGPAPGG
jgi:hypothetical protein